MAFCAFLSLEDATIFMADVIFIVPLTELILSFISFSEAILRHFYSISS